MDERTYIHAKMIRGPLCFYMICERFPDWTYDTPLCCFICGSWHSSFGEMALVREYMRGSYAIVLMKRMEFVLVAAKGQLD